ncbi:uncharacterized protein A1O9_04825 [Exophiala aquamarina CBS 119918]|uniref:SAP domain-containing protein n=1 Tax=Exophiala aquamarina CBS 119918 TaxID=1182545 RepID=A0A072PJN9_9EURO|nr:uncharacterized protein A1O9_04825 [Exophiala aquamarina CBS 119918]KEF59977.1 hypothetical protein A1O9_04825 [Exophiala aquamarina CBS 119918]
MVDYAKKTVAELQEILKSRSLPHTGKKADLIARLNEADTATEQAEVLPVADVPAPQEQTVSAPEPVAEPEFQAEAVTTETAAATTQADTAASPSANTDTALATSASYALNLPTSEVDAEMAKRKARAERFGTENAATNGVDDADSEAQRALERAKRFGTGQTAMGKLDEALPTERGRGLRKRGRPDEDSPLDDAGLRRGFGGHGRGRGGRFRGRGPRDNSRRRQGDRPTGVVKASAAFTSDADRLAAEARKKKFAT